MSRGRLWHRLLLSHLAVVAAGGTVILVTTRVLAPRLFERGYGEQARPGAGPRGEAHDALVEALDRALIVGMAVSVVVATTLAVIAARRLARPIERIRGTARLLAQGHYDHRVPGRAPGELGALAADVDVLAAALAQTEDRRRALVRELTHELRTPITTVSGYLEAFQDGVLTPSPEAIAEVSDELGRLERLVADLGLLSRLDEGSLELDRAPTDLADVVRTVAVRLGPQFQAGGVHLDVTTESVVVDGDPDRLAQVVINVVGNALRYTATGGRVQVRCGPEGTHACCIVTDTGRGLRADEHEDVFVRFRRGSAAAGTPGTGVGLTIARSLARAHGGDLVADSAGPGRGATFTLRLPRRP